MESSSAELLRTKCELLSKLVDELQNRLGKKSLPRKRGTLRTRPYKRRRHDDRLELGPYKATVFN